MIVLLGGTGQLGRALHAADPTLYVPTRAQADLAHVTGLCEYLSVRRPTWVINAAAQHDARRAEDNPVRDLLLNAAAPRHLARECEHHGARLLQLSTNYVFGGDERTGPFAEFEHVAPVTAYGIAKYAGERLVQESSPTHVIVRTSALFGPGIGDGFPTKHVLNGIGTLHAVNDQWIVPTYAPDLAHAILRLIAQDAKGGVYHLVGEGGPVTWLEYAHEVLAITGHTRPILSVTTEEYGERVPRPRHAALMNTRAAVIGIRMRPWRDGLREHLLAQAQVAP